MPVSVSRKDRMSLYIDYMFTTCRSSKEEALINPAFKVRNLWLDFLNLTYRSAINRRLPYQTGLL
jgi:hypothetical protein